MATNSLQSLHHHHSLLRRHSIDCPPSSSTLSSSLFFKPTTTNFSTSLNHSNSISSSITFSSLSPSTTSTTPSTSQPVSLDLLQQHLISKNFREADEETRRLIIALAGEAAQKRGYVFFSEVQFIPQNDLKAIDDLWRQHSNNRFGYSIQKKIWNKVNKDFTRFFIKVGWMKKLDTEVEQHNYRAFPNEFTWELNDDSPEEGHLPLTNALRGTQLLNCIFNHPAFDFQSEEQDEEMGIDVAPQGKARISKPSPNMGFKTDYSF